MKERSFSWSWPRLGLALVAAALAGGAIAGFILLAGKQAAAQQQPGQIQLQILPGGAFVQQGRGRFSENEVVDVFLPVDRETTRQWEKAKSLIDDGRYGDGVTLLDEILQRGEDYFFKPDADKPNYRSLKAEAQQLIANLPEEGRQSYELQFGARAGQMLTAASSTGDVIRLEEIARRFFHTRAGYQATLLLGRLHLDHDRPLAASMCFERLYDAPAAAEKFEPSLSVLLANSYLRSNRPKDAEKKLLDLKKSNPQATLRLAGKSVRLFTDDRQAIAWLQANLGNRQSQQPKELENWLLARGNPARNATSPGSLPLLNPRWRVSTTDQPVLEKTLADIRKYFIQQGTATLPAMQPLAVGDLVLMRTARDLFAVDFVTGRRLWPIRSTGNTSIEQFLPSSSSVGSSSDPQRNFGLTQRFWQDVTFGTLSCDGQQVFLIDDLDVAPNLPMADMNGMLMMGQPARLRGGRWVGGIDAESLGYKRFNRLAAHELRTQGKLKWQIGGQTGDDEPQLAEAFFLGPPLPLQGKLYVLAEIKGEIKLCVLDAKTGRLDWSQQVALVDQNIQIDPYRRLVGCTPSFADGVLVCPTSAGAIVAVDIANRTLLWGYRYDRDRQNSNIIINRQGMMYGASGNSAERWLDNNLTIGEGKVLVTPAESNQLYCLDLKDGQPAWNPQSRGDNLYVAGIHQGKAVLVNKRQLVTAIQLENGKPVTWTAPASRPPVGSQVLIPDPNGAVMPSGRGFLSGDNYFLPLTSGEVVRFDLTTGKIAERKKSRNGTIPGNLICHQGDVISQGVDYVETFFQLEPLGQRVAKLLKENPEDSWALAHRGEIALEEGRVDQAIADVRRAYQAEPTPFNRDMLIQALQAGLTKDFAKHRDALHDLEQLVKLDRERAMFLRVLAAGLQQSGESAAALDAYLRLSVLEPEANELEEIDTQYSVLRPRWVRAQFAELMASANPKDRAAIDTTIGRQVDRLMAADQASGSARAAQLRQFLNCFGDHPLAERVSAALADELTGTDAVLEREQWLLRLDKSFDTQRRRAAQAKLASLLSEHGQVDAALAIYRRLKADAPTQAVLNGKNVQQILASLPADSALRHAEAQDRAWPDGAVKVETNSKGVPRNSGSQRFNLEIRDSRDPFFTGVNVHRVVESNQGHDQIVGVDALGRDLFQILVNDENRLRVSPFGMPQIGYLTSYAFVRGHVLVISTGTQVYGIDTLRGPGTTGNRVLWQRELADPTAVGGGMPQQDMTAWGTRRRARNQINLVLGEVAMCGEHTLCIRQGQGREPRELTAIDPLTGNVQWVRRGIEPGCEIFGDDEVVVLVAKDRPTKFLRTLDGKPLDARAPLSTGDDVWTTVGRKVLAWRNHANGNRLLVMVDPWTQRELWKVEFPQGVKGALVDGKFAAILQPADGKFVMLDLAIGRKVIEEQLLPAPGLQNIHVLSSTKQLIVATNCTSPERSSRTRVATTFMQPAMNVYGELPCPLISGHVYALDRDTGKQQWPTPALVENHGLILDQPDDLPVLAFVRNVQPLGGQQTTGSILCLDKRDGRLLYEEDELPQPINSWSMVGKLEDRSVTLQPPGQLSITLKFTSAPQPPEPPYQVGAFEKAEAAAPRGQPAPNRSPADRG